MKHFNFFLFLLLPYLGYSQTLEVNTGSGATLPSGTINQTLRNSTGGTTYVANSALLSDGTNAGVGAIGTEKFGISAGNIQIDNNYFLRGKNTGGTLANLIGINASDNVQIQGPTGTDIYFGPSLNTVIKQTGGLGIATGGSTYGTLGIAQINNIVSHTNATQGAIVIGNKSAGHYMCLDWKGSASNNPIGRISVEHVGTDNSIMRFGTSNAFSSGITNTAMQINKEGQIGIGLTTSQDSSALLEMNSNTMGFLPPQLTTTERNAISSPKAGLVIFNSTLQRINYYGASAWRSVLSETAADSTYWKLGGQVIGATASIGPTDAQTFNLSTGGTPRLSLSGAGKLNSGTLTDIQLTASDSVHVTGSGGAITINSGFTRFYEGSTVRMQINNSTGAISKVLPSNTASAYSVTVSGAGNVLLHDSSTGAQITTLGNATSGAKTILDSEQTELSGRLETAKGSDVASATNVTLGNDGNFFTITGTTTINTIVTTNWQAGSEITLLFAASVTVNDNGTSAGNLILAGNVDFSATAADVLKLVTDGTDWYEVSRSVN